MRSEDFMKLLERTDIREFKLMDGSTIMCEVVDITDGKYLISDPMIMRVDMSHGMVMYPWFFSDGEKFTELDESRILASSIVNDSLKVTYMRHLLKLNVLAQDDDGENEFLMDMNPPEDGTFH